jgi:NAD(P)H dehydrogenase (quinone)
MEMGPIYLVTGATGPTGSFAAQELRKGGAPVRALVHKDDERVNHLKQIGAEIIIADLLDYQAVRAALNGIAAAYFVYPIRSGLVDATAYFAQAALDEGVKAIVNMSQISARPDSKSNAARDHWICERLFDRSGVPTTHLRPTFFAQWLLYHGRGRRIAETGTMRFPFGRGRHAPIAAEDQGRVIAAVLKQPGPHAGKTYPLFGPVEMDHYELAERISGPLGRKVSYVPQEIEEFHAQFAANPNAPPHLVQHLCEVAQDYQDGVFRGTNDHVERITGSKPLSIEDFVRLHRSEFAAATP